MARAMGSLSVATTGLDGDDLEGERDKVAAGGCADTCRNRHGGDSVCPGARRLAGFVAACVSCVAGADASMLLALGCTFGAGRGIFVSNTKTP